MKLKLVKKESKIFLMKKKNERKSHCILFHKRSRMNFNLIDWKEWKGLFFKQQVFKCSSRELPFVPYRTWDHTTIGTFTSITPFVLYRRIFAPNYLTKDIPVPWISLYNKASAMMLLCLKYKSFDGQVYVGGARKAFNSVPYRRYEIKMRKSWRTGTSVDKTCQQFAAVHRFQEAFFLNIQKKTSC
jgi:hypothetical protein